MKQSLFNLIALLLLPLLPITTLGSPSDSTSLPSPRKWDKRVHQRYEGWERLRPTHIKIPIRRRHGSFSSRDRMGLWQTPPVGKRFSSRFPAGQICRQVQTDLYCKTKLYPLEHEFRQALGTRAFLLRTVCNDHCRRGILEKRTRTLSQRLLQFQYQDAPIHFYRTTDEL